MRTRERTPQPAPPPVRTRGAPAPVAATVVTGRSRTRDPAQNSTPKAPAPAARTRAPVATPAPKVAPVEKHKVVVSASGFSNAGKKWYQAGMPTQWPNGSAYMRNPTLPGFVKGHVHTWGMDYEENPNLLGRWVNDGDGYRAWRWNWKMKQYTFMGRFANMSAALASIKPH